MGRKEPEASTVAPTTVVDGDDHGASMVEFALVGPLFMAMVFVLFEASIGVFSLISMNTAAADAAREASVRRQEPLADVAVLERFFNVAGLAVASQVNTVIVYRAVDDSGPPASCQAGIATEGCNIYRGPYLTDPASLCEGGGGGWCPEDRLVGESVGVWFDSEYTGVTGIIPTRWTRTGLAVAEIEANLPP